MFYGFQCTGLVHLLLDLSLISLYLYTIAVGIISIPEFSLLTKRNTIDLYIVSLHLAVLSNTFISSSSFGDSTEFSI